MESNPCVLHGGLGSHSEVRRVRRTQPSIERKGKVHGPEARKSSVYVQKVSVATEQ